MIQVLVVRSVIDVHSIVAPDHPPAHQNVRCPRKRRYGPRTVHANHQLRRMDPHDHRAARSEVERQDRRVYRVADVRVGSVQPPLLIFNLGVELRLHVDAIPILHHREGIHLHAVAPPRKVVRQRRHEHLAASTIEQPVVVAEQHLHRPGPDPPGQSLLILFSTRSCATPRRPQRAAAASIIPSARRSATRSHEERSSRNEVTLSSSTSPRPPSSGILASLAAFSAIAL